VHAEPALVVAEEIGECSAGVHTDAGWGGGRHGWG